MCDCSISTPSYNLLKHVPRLKANVVLSVFPSSKRAVDESEVEAAERRSLRCVWVTGGRALTEQEAAVQIVSEARLLLQEDLAQLGVQWDPATLPPGAPAVNSSDEHHSRESDTSSATYLGSREAPAANLNDHQEDRVKTSESRDTDRHKKENKEEYKCEKRMKMERAEGEAKREQGEPKPKHNGVNGKLEEHRKQDRTEPEIRLTSNEVQVERSKETKKDETNTKILTANDTEDPDEKRERQKHVSLKEGREKLNKEPKEGESSEGTVSVRPDSHTANRPIAERSLTQELAEIVCSPLPQPMPRPQPSPSTVPPPRFRAPISRVAEQHSVPARTSKGDGTTGLAASPVQPGRLMHSRALSKVLQSIQTDIGPQVNAQTSHSKPTGVSSLPAGQVPTPVHAPGPVQEIPPGISAPTNADMQDSPTSVPLFSPEAKRRRIDGREVDKFSSPELYAGDERGEEVEGAVRRGEESFGESFELDTQTERIIVQKTCQHRDGSDRGMNQSVKAERIKELDEDTNEGSNSLEAPDNSCPRFSISLTDSQMELILNTSHQVRDQNHPLCTDYKCFLDILFSCDVVFTDFS